MGLSSAMDWWDEWKLRILVLCSLFVQFFLYFSEIVRAWYALRRLRVMVWIAYIGGDALAIYALATLFNRQKQQAGNALEVIWAPVLLIHLGGQTISAYSLEDNELWRRHALTLVSQVTVALYVFCKWWSGEKRLLHAAILLFIIGIVRFTEKPWALRRASFQSVESTTVDLSTLRAKRRSCSMWSQLCYTNFVDLTIALARKKQGGGGVKEEEEEEAEAAAAERCLPLKEYIKQAQECFKEGPNKKQAASSVVQPGLFWFKMKIFAKAQEDIRMHYLILPMKYIHRMFLDLTTPYSVRLHCLESILKFDDADNKIHHRLLRLWIGRQFGIMYTKFKSTVTCFGCCLSCLLSSLALASVVLFAKSDKDGYSKGDITVTYILFSGTVVIEFAPFWATPLIDLALFILTKMKGPEGVPHPWQDMVSQHNIMLFCARKKKPTTLMKLAVFSYPMDYINKHWYIRHEPAALQISALVRRHTEDGWKEYIRDPATYRRFSNFRGEQTLKKHNLLGQLGWSFALPFDECVLVWHVATDLCSFHHTTTSTRFTIPPPSRNSSEIISNHMIYLLFVCPEMLMVGTRQDLFMNACGHIEPMIKDYEPEPLSSHDRASIIALRILGMERDDDLMVKAPMISNAHKLAEGLIGLDDTRRWEVIQGVWVEMLCYSASRCRGYEHAKSLAHGGEFLTNVWLLWSVMGMETLPDKMHNPAGPESDPDEEQPPPAASGWH
ncbi:unnamed protein product [Urochloa humidicola]